MLEAKEVVKSFDGFRALDSATLTVPKGTVYGLVGPNGAGKSTFLKILSGQLEPTNGEVAITPGQRLSFLQQDHFKYDAYTAPTAANFCWRALPFGRTPTPSGAWW